MKEVYEPCSTAESQKAACASETEETNAVLQKMFQYIPICNWLPNYQWKHYFHGDLIAGLTVGIMHVPQGMAYASLAGVPPVYGMYSSFFASIIYMLFGTSRHVSIGVFAVASMMVGACRFRLLPDHEINSVNSTYSLGPDVTPLMLTSALTFVVGCLQILLGLLRLGFLATYLSDPLVSGFTTGSAAHVMVSQLNKVFGVKMPRHEGMGMLLKMVQDLISYLPSTNLVTLMISIISILFLDLGRTFINPLVKKFSPIPPPLELILVIMGIFLSITLNLDQNYNVRIVNTIPRGFPSPSLPKSSLFPVLLPDAIPIAIVCYMFVMSMGKLFAKKHKYNIDATQELYAVGLMSVASSIFPVYPVGASLSRSSVCEMSGANTQLYTVFSSILLLTVIIFLGPFLEPLPMCILACIVIVSLKSLFLQIKDLPRYWRISRYDFAIWLVACMATILTDVTKGLIISLAFSITTVVLREQWPRFLDIVPSITPPQIVPDQVRIVKFESPLHFANVNVFIDNLSEIIASARNETFLPDRAIIIDATAMSYIDTMGFDALKQIYIDAKKSNIEVFYCGLNDSAFSVIENDEILKKSIPKKNLQPSINEALLYLSTV